MTTLTNRTATALLVIDVQNGVVEGAYGRNDIVNNMVQLVKKARIASVPVIWVQHSDEELESGSDTWQIVPELEPHPDESLIHKLYRSSFEETDLEAVLASLGVGSVVICVAQTNNCVRNTIHAAYERGYDVTLAEDAHTTTDGPWDDGIISAKAIIDEQNRACIAYQLPGRSCDIALSTDLFN